MLETAPVLLAPGNVLGLCPSVRSLRFAVIQYTGGIWDFYQFLEVQYRLKISPIHKTYSEDRIFKQHNIVHVLSLIATPSILT